ncbi:hypothetical protein F7725_013450 [Dissostichus mawsoni]|uniref:Uncharacterized protein n=1 Tax=Dissostichus mawsoni TaxID=36200 RepID=A0A7J5YU56_DISMA|nr:hypothetical protein F7725_013450 [Dissostichus mawsoni]
MEVEKRANGFDFPERNTAKSVNGRQHESEHHAESREIVKGELLNLENALKPLAVWSPKSLRHSGGRGGRRRGRKGGGGWRSVGGVQAGTVGQRLKENALSAPAPAEGLSSLGAGWLSPPEFAQCSALAGSVR